MSVLMLFAVYDSKVGAYAAPFCCRTKGEAIRSFSDACSDDSLPFRKNPADYRLFYLGAYDDAVGELVSVKPEPLLGADEVERPPVLRSVS